ncbi:MAG TPA: flagellar basal body M-ring protein FliF [Gammaproteobacteria bacterium]|nr:flagellar basal body M-ring protein FliF [Gammaproteobacteria bacterium]
MAIMTADNVAIQAQGFGSLPALRQLGLMLGLAISVALGVTVALWSQTPNYSMLYGNLTAKDLSQVTTALNNSGISYKLEPGSGGIMVPSEKVQEARMKLANTGFTGNSDVGFELLDKDQGLGSNRFLLKARYQRALEGELAQSITKLNMIEGARVHLAIPKRSAFARKSRSPSASVVLNLYPGRSLNDVQTAGIVNIVASSVPGLESEHVTVVDDRGRLLSSTGDQSDMTLSSSQFDYTRKLEDRYTKRIIDIISPIVGSEGVRAQVSADIDFTSQEETKESYSPEQKALRSEQLFEQNSTQQGPVGIPGALSNQPPAGGSTDKTSEQAAGSTGNNSSRALRNYEIDKTISHVRQSPTVLKHLSVAVIVDYRTTVGKKGKVTREPLSEDEVNYVKALVKEAIGLDEERGDTLNVVNTPFQLPEEVEPLPEAPIWEQPWVLTVAKQALGGLFVLFIVFGVLRPMLSNLAKQGQSSAAAIAALPAGEQAAALGKDDDRLTLSNQNAGVSALPAGQQGNGQQLLDMASNIVKEDPKRAAQVLNTWVEADG